MKLNISLCQPTCFFILGTGGLMFFSIFLNFSILIHAPLLSDAQKVIIFSPAKRLWYNYI